MLFYKHFCNISTNYGLREVKLKKKKIYIAGLNSILAAEECREAAVSESTALKEMTCTQGLTS